METTLSYQNKKSKGCLFKISLFLILSLVTVISCNVDPTAKDPPGISALTPPGIPALTYALRIDGMTVKLTPNKDNLYGINTDGSLPTSASYNFYYTPTSSFITTPTPQDVKSKVMSNSTTINISNVTGPTNLVISSLTQSTIYYIVVEAVHTISSKTALSEVFTKRTASIQASDRANLCATISAIIATNNTADLNHIDTSQITSMLGLFSKDYDCEGGYVADARSYMGSFNGNIYDWDTSKVDTMAWVFTGASSFNQDISSWNTANVTTMAWMFSFTTFNQDISGWNTSKVTTMESMFNNASAFNQDISGWDTSKVNDMSHMFHYASAFNGSLSGWNVSSVTTMENMFKNATAFNQDISTWNVTGKTVTDMFKNATSMQAGNYPQGYTP